MKRSARRVFAEERHAAVHTDTPNFGAQRQGADIRLCLMGVTQRIRPLGRYGLAGSKRRAVGAQSQIDLPEGTGFLPKPFTPEVLLDAVFSEVLAYEGKRSS